MLALSFLLADNVGHPRGGHEAEGDQDLKRHVERVESGVDLILVLGPWENVCHAIMFINMGS